MAVVVAVAVVVAAVVVAFPRCLWWSPSIPPTNGDKSSEDGVWLAAHAVSAGFIDLHFWRVDGVPQSQ